jgi:hypothetical protein
MQTASMYVAIFQPDSLYDPPFRLLSDSGPPCLLKLAASSRTERFSAPGPTKLQ